MSDATLLDGQPPAPTSASGERHGIARAAGLIGLGNIASRVLGLVREMAIANQFGAGALAAIFTIASQVPSTLYDLLIGGLLSSALVPVFSAYATRDDDNDALWKLASLVISLVGILLALLSLLVLLLAPQITWLYAGDYEEPLRALTTQTIRLISPSIFFFGLSGALIGLLYALKRFTFAAFAAAVFNIGIIVGALLLSRAFEGDQRIIGLALGLVLGSAFQLALLLPDLRDAPLRFRLGAFWRDPGLRRIGQLYIPVALSVIVASAGVVIDRRLATGTGIVGVVPWMKNATTLIQFPLGLVAAAISLAVLPSLSRLAALEDTAGYRQTLQTGLRLVLVLIVPAAVGLFVLAEPIIRLLFEHGEFTALDTAATALALRVYLIGLVFAAVDQLLIIAFYSRQDTWTPALVGIVAVGVYLLVALPLVGAWSMIALVLADSAKHFTHAMVMLALLQRRLGGLVSPEMNALVGRVLAAALAMGAAVWLAALLTRSFDAGLTGEILAVLLPSLVGLATYAVVVTLLRIEEARQVAQLLLRRMQR